MWALLLTGELPAPEGGEAGLRALGAHLTLPSLALGKKLKPREEEAHDLESDLSGLQC